MLNYKYPSTEKLGSYLNNFSEHKRFIAHSIGRDDRFRGNRNANLPGPGAYRVERDYPENEDDDIGSHCRTGVHVPPKYSIPTESRTAPDGAMKGISPSPFKALPDSTGPGQYPLIRLGVQSHEKEFVTYTIPKAIESQEALRARKRTSDVPGPGVYSVKRYGDDLGLEKQKLIERAIKKGIRTTPSAQYSHIYQCMKPRTNSMPVLPAAEVTSRQFVGLPSQEPSTQSS